MQAIALFKIVLIAYFHRDMYLRGGSMNKKIVLVAWLLCGMQVFGMARKSTIRLPWTKGYSSEIPWMQGRNVAPLSATSTAPATSSISSNLMREEDAATASSAQTPYSSRFTMPKFNKRQWIAPAVIGAGALASEAYHWNEAQLLQEQLKQQQEKLAEEEAKNAWLLNKQKQEAKKSFDEIQTAFEQKPDAAAIPTVLEGYGRWISKLQREELNNEFRSVVDQYIKAKEDIFNRKWNKLWYLYMSKKDVRMRDAEKLEMDNEFTHMSQILDNVKKTDKNGALVLSDQFLRGHLKSMKKDVLIDKVQQAWWLNTLSRPAVYIDEWIREKA